MKVLSCLILACFTAACSSHSKTFVVQDRTGQPIEFTSLRYCTGGNVWDTCRGDVELTITKGSIEITKVIPRNFEGIESIEILEGSGENLSAFTKAERNAEIRLWSEELAKILSQEKFAAKMDELREAEAREKLEAKRDKLEKAKPGEALPREDAAPPPPPHPEKQKSKKDELSDKIASLTDSLKELKIRVTYTSGETVEGIRKRNDWQNEDYIYGTSKVSDESVRLDIAKMGSIKVKTNE